MYETRTRTFGRIRVTGGRNAELLWRFLLPHRHSLCVGITQPLTVRGAGYRFASVRTSETAPRILIRFASDRRIIGGPAHSPTTTAARSCENAHPSAHLCHGAPGAAGPARVDRRRRPPPGGSNSPPPQPVPRTELPGARRRRGRDSGGEHAATRESPWGFRPIGLRCTATSPSEGRSRSSRHHAPGLESRRVGPVPDLHHRRARCSAGTGWRSTKPGRRRPSRTRTKPAPPRASATVCCWMATTTACSTSSGARAPEATRAGRLYRQSRDD